MEDMSAQAVLRSDWKFPFRMRQLLPSQPGQTGVCAFPKSVGVVACLNTTAKPRHVFPDRRRHCPIGRPLRTMWVVL